MLAVHATYLIFALVALAGLAAMGVKLVAVFAVLKALLLRAFVAFAAGAAKSINFGAKVTGLSAEYWRAVPAFASLAAMDVHLEAVIASLLGALNCWAFEAFASLAVVGIDLEAFGTEQTAFAHLSALDLLWCAVTRLAANVISLSAILAVVSTAHFRTLLAFACCAAKVIMGKSVIAMQAANVVVALMTQASSATMAVHLESIVAVHGASDF